MIALIETSAPGGGRIALAATWQAKAGEAEAVAEILRRMANAVKSEPGTLLFWPHRSSSDDRVFFLYELFADDAAFAAHQQTEHFKTLVVGEALPKLERRAIHAAEALRRYIFGGAHGQGFCCLSSSEESFPLTTKSL